MEYLQRCRATAQDLPCIQSSVPNLYRECAPTRWGSFAFATVAAMQVQPTPWACQRGRPTRGWDRQPPRKDRRKAPNLGPVARASRHPEVRPQMATHVRISRPALPSPACQYLQLNLALCGSEKAYIQTRTSRQVDWHKTGL